MSEKVMNELIARLEKATGPDRELDEAIAAACQAYEVIKVHSPPLLQNCTVQNTPLFTASIDAALTLVPEGWWWTIKHAPHRRGAFVSLHNHNIGGGDLSIADSLTPALAICLAALKVNHANA